jgi:hypothetical protein
MRKDIPHRELVRRLVNCAENDEKPSAKDLFDAASLVRSVSTAKEISDTTLENHIRRYWGELPYAMVIAHREYARALIRLMQ